MRNVPTIETLMEDVKSQLGPIFKAGDEEVLKKLIGKVQDEAFEVANRMFETDQDRIDLESCVIQSSVIAYQNRGIEGQTRQQELGQENHFIDWHNYLRDTVITHGKRFVI